MRYELIELGTLGGADSLAHDINNDGHVVGMSDILPDGYEKSLEIIDYNVPWHAYLWRDGIMRDIDSMNSVRSQAYAISNSGIIVGEVASLISDRMHQACKWENDTLTVLNPNWQSDSIDTEWYGGSTAKGVNNLGRIVGTREHDDGDDIQYELAIQWDNDAGIPLVLEGFDSGDSYALDINSAGQIVGLAGAHAYFFDKDIFKPVGFPGSFRSAANAINDRSQIVGYSSNAKMYDHAFFWEDGKTTALGTFGGKVSLANDINEHGHVVGMAGMPGSDPDIEWNYHAFIWLGEHLIDLNECTNDLRGWVLDTAHAINDHGQIVGESRRDGVTQAFLLNPM